MRAGTFFPDMLDALARQPLLEFLVACKKTILFPASNPKQLQLSVGLEVQVRELRCVVGAAAPGAKSANPGETIQIIQAYRQRLSSAHRQPGERACLLLGRNAIC